MQETPFNPTMVAFGGQRKNIYTEISIKARWEQLAGYIQATLKKYSVSPPEELAAIETRYATFLHECGVVSATEPKPITYISPKDIPAIDAELARVGTSVVLNSLGFSSLMYGNVLILEEGVSNLTLSYGLAEEQFHSVGEQVLAYSPTQTEYTRIGFCIFSEKRARYGWFLEEAFAKYYSRLFLMRLETEGYLAEDFMRLQKKIEYFSEKGRYQNGKVIFPDTRFYADPYHLYLVERKNEEQKKDVLALHVPDIIAADVFTDMIASLDSATQKSLLDTLLLARQDHRRILDAAKHIDTCFGKGTYVTMMRCQPTFEDIFQVREQLTSRIR